MGVIQRQGLKHSIVNLVGLVIGGASTLWLYPLVVGEYGTMQLLLTAGVLALPLLSLGANTVSIRFFPYFEDKKSGHHGFLVLLMSMCLAGFTLAGLVAAFAWTPLMRALPEGKAATLTHYIWAAIPIICLWVTSVILSVYSSNFKRIVVPSLLIDFSQKIFVPILLFGVYKRWLTLDQAIGGLVLFSGLVFLSMVFYLRHLGQWHWKPDWQFITPKLRKEIGNFIVFGSFGGFALLLISKADLFMVGSLLPIDNAGIYAIAAFLAATIEIPTRSLYSASVATVSKHIVDQNYTELHDLYRRVSINLLCIGLVLFGALWVSIDSVYGLMQKTEVVATGKWVFFFIGFSKLIDMATGLNNYMIYYSPHYRLALLPMGLMAAANILFSIWLIPQYGLTGAAMATCLAVGLYNVFSLWIVWQKFRLQPFDTHTVVAIAMAVFAFVLVSIIPHFPAHPLLDVVLHSGLYVALSGGLILAFRVSSDMNDMLRQLIQKNPLRQKAKK